MKTKQVNVRFDMDDYYLLENSPALDYWGHNPTDRVRNLVHSFIAKIEKKQTVSRLLWAQVLKFKEDHPEIESDSFEEVIREILKKLDSK